MVNSSTSLRDTTRTASRMASHYAAQLAAAGWTVHPPVADDRVAAHALDATDKSGRVWHGVLLVVTNAGEHAISVSMNPAEK
jgi:hypothetical protein